MHELKADLWDIQSDLRVITTNGFVKNDGAAVMGRGCAKEAVQLYGMQLAYQLGMLLDSVGNYPFLLRPNLATLPVKHNWWEEADIELIVKSARKLVDLVNIYGFSNIILPRPGCGNGKLDWYDQVRPEIIDLLDNRFTVVDYA